MASPRPTVATPNRYTSGQAVVSDTPRNGISLIPAALSMTGRYAGTMSALATTGPASASAVRSRKRQDHAAPRSVPSDPNTTSSHPAAPSEATLLRFARAEPSARPGIAVALDRPCEVRASAAGARPGARETGTSGVAAQRDRPGRRQRAGRGLDDDDRDPQHDTDRLGRLAPLG